MINNLAHHDHSISGGKLPQSHAETFLYPPAADRVVVLRSVEEICWRIKIQVLAMQMDDYLLSQTDQERDIWKSRMLDQLIRINQQAQQFSPQTMPSDLRPASLARIAEQGNWLDTLTRQLTEVFLNVPTADTLKIN